MDGEGRRTRRAEILSCADFASSERVLKLVLKPYNLFLYLLVLPLWMEPAN